MKAIIDESVPRDLLPLLREAGCNVVGFPKEWKGTKNGQLQSPMEEAGFECLITSDKNLPFQQNPSRRRLAVVVLPSPKFVELSSIIDGIAIAVAGTPAGEVARV